MIRAHLPISLDPAIQTLASAYSWQARAAALIIQTGRVAAVADCVRDLAPATAALKQKVSTVAATRLRSLGRQAAEAERQAATADYGAQATNSSQAVSLQAASADAATMPPRLQQTVYASRRRWPVEECKELLAKQFKSYSTARERYSMTSEDAAQRIQAQLNGSTTGSGISISNSNNNSINYIAHLSHP